MIFDKTLLFLDSEAFNATVKVLDLRNTFRPEGDMTSIKGRIVCAGGDAAGATALTIITGTTNNPATTIATLPMTHTQMNAGFNFTIPADNLRRYLKIGITGISAGTKITAGLVLDTQTA